MAERKARYRTRPRPRPDYEAAFVLAWRQFGPAVDLERQYYFARQAVGDRAHPPARPGLRKRLAARGLRDWRFDFALPAARLAVEIDGGQWKPGGGRHGGDPDREKCNAAAALGWRVLHYSPAMLDDPEAVVAQVRQALEVRRELK